MSKADLVSQTAAVPIAEGIDPTQLSRSAARPGSDEPNNASSDGKLRARRISQTYPHERAIIAITSNISGVGRIRSSVGASSSQTLANQRYLTLSFTSEILVLNLFFSSPFLGFRAWFVAPLPCLTLKSFGTVVPSESSRCLCCR